MPGGQLWVVTLSLVLLCAVPVLTSIQLRRRRFRWLLVVSSVVFYLLVGNCLSRAFLAGMIYPLDPSRSGLTLTEPWEGFARAAAMTLNGSPSGSRSLASTVIVVGVLRAVEARSSTATGGAFSATTFSATIALLPAVPSDTV